MAGHAATPRGRLPLMGADRWVAGEDRDPCDDTGPIPALPHGELDRDDDLQDSGEGEVEDPEDDDVAPAFDELAAELEDSAEGDDGDDRTLAALPSPAVVEVAGGTTRIDPFAETGDPDALSAQVGETARVREPVTASAITDRLAVPDTTAAVAGLPMGTPPSEPSRGAAGEPALDEGRAPPRREPAPPTRGLRALTAAAATLPLLVVLALLALGVPQTAFRRWSGRDRLEPNDAFAAARPLAPGKTEGLSCGGADVDWFALEAPPGQALVIEVSPAPAGQGGASLHTVDGQRVAVIGRGETRLVHAVSGPAVVPLRLCVWGARPDYAVTVSLAPLGSRFEPNDSALGAAPVRPGRVRAVQCNGEDWYRVPIPAHHTARARLEGAPAGLTLGWASGAVAPIISGREVAARPLGLDRVALLRVAGTGPYDLAIELEAAAGGGRDARRLEPGEYPHLECSSSDEWRVGVSAGQMLEVAVREPRSTWNLSVSLYDEQLQPIGVSTSHRVEGGAAVTRLTAFAAQRDGEVVVRVHGPPIEYALEVWTTSAAALQSAPSTTPEPVATPSGIRALAPGIYPEQVVSGEMWYSLEVGAEQQLLVTAESAAEDDIGLDLFDDLGQPVAAASLGEGNVEMLQHLAASSGRLLLRVTAYSTQSCTLTVSIDGSTAPVELPVGRHEGLECTGNAFFGVAVPGGQRLVLEISFASAEGDLDLQLLGAGGELLARSESLDDRERVEYVAAVDETLTVRVYNAKNRFDAEVRIEEP